jgi:hypothetical protein
MTKKTVQELFPGLQILDSEPVLVENPYSGESYTLTPEEVAVYDLIKGAEMMGDHKILRQGLDWFIDNNASAYMALLD